jgi:hypothetical protein
MRATTFQAMKAKSMGSTTKPTSSAFIQFAKNHSESDVIKRNALILCFLESLSMEVIEKIPEEIGQIADSDEDKFHSVLKDLIFNSALLEDSRILAATILVSWLTRESPHGTASEEEKNI